MPEATIDKDRDLGPREHDVRSRLTADVESEVNSIAEPATV